MKEKKIEDWIVVKFRLPYYKNPSNDFEKNTKAKGPWKIGLVQKESMDLLNKGEFGPVELSDFFVPPITDLEEIGRVRITGDVDKMCVFSLLEV